MSKISERIALARSLLASRCLFVTDVGHSVGSTISIGAGKTISSRYKKPARGIRRPGYYKSAFFDLLLVSADWEITGRTGYKLRWSDNARRIAKEASKLVGSEIRTVYVPRFKDRIRIGFHNGMSLTVWPDRDDSDCGWVLWLRRRPFSLGDAQ